MAFPEGTVEVETWVDECGTRVEPDGREKVLFPHTFQG